MPYSETGGHYFYKRYRASLLALLRSIGEVEQFRQEATLRGAGFEPTPEILDALKGVDVAAVKKLAAAFGEDSAA